MEKLQKRIIRTRMWLALFLVIVVSANGVLTATAYAKPNKVDKSAPSAPKYLHTTSVTDTSVALSWNASTDNVKVTYYEIYKNNSLTGTSNTTTYLVSGLKPNTSYNFYVVAKDAANNRSAKSNILKVTTVKATLVPTATPVPTVTPVPTATPVPTVTPTPTVTPAPTGSDTKVIGYYAAWAAYSGYTPDKIDATKLTHINYAFANIGSDFKIALGYPDVDASNLAKLNALKQTNPNLKILIAVGGWSWSGRFSDAALTDASRTAFAESCVAFLVKYGLDGVDIDWEYPVTGGLSTNIRRPEDKTNFTLLMQKLREKLDLQETIDGKQYILSFAGAAGAWYLNNIELTKLQESVDYVNLMTYDIHGTWDQYTDFNAPLYNNSDPSPQYKDSVDQAVRTWLAAGLPTEKLIIGVPFYGYIFKAVANINNGLYQTYSGAQSINYTNIAANYLNAPGYVRYFHTESKVPWLFNGSTFITYEDEESMAFKAEYIKTKGLGGAMIWELSQDQNNILLGALYNELK